MEIAPPAKLAVRFPSVVSLSPSLSAIIAGRAPVGAAAGRALADVPHNCQLFVTKMTVAGIGCAHVRNPAFFRGVEIGAVDSSEKFVDIPAHVRISLMSNVCPAHPSRVAALQPQARSAKLNAICLSHSHCLLGILVEVTMCPSFQKYFCDSIGPLEGGTQGGTM